MSDKEELELLIYRWLFSTEVYYQNLYIDCLNNFSKSQHHDISDFFYLYHAELRFEHFKLFSDDLIKLLRFGK